MFYYKRDEDKIELDYDNYSYYSLIFPESLEEKELEIRKEMKRHPENFVILKPERYKYTKYHDYEVWFNISDIKLILKNGLLYVYHQNEKKTCTSRAIFLKKEVLNPEVLENFQPQPYFIFDYVDEFTQINSSLEEDKKGNKIRKEKALKSLPDDLRIVYETCKKEDFLNN